MLAKGNRLFIAGLLEMNPDKKYYPDANSTMRATYGNVGDYKPGEAMHYDYYTTIDGRYDQKRPYFSLAEINKENLKIREFKFSYDILPFPSEIRYMTGFSVIKI